ncbi:class I SAM-dependent methyltransferase [Micromonospora sp. NPDC048170]|uniref:class I SAM-dependent methyltransferase n=1 Tax=Micromonospora sp. NPDC048170 TaxID=3154819 RepID=UPI0033E9F08E
MSATAIGPEATVGQRMRGEALRRAFLHQDGLAVTAALAALDQTGTLARLSAGAALPVGELVAGAAPGAVAACLRAAHSAGWLTVDNADPDPHRATVRLADHSPAAMTALAGYRMVWEAVEGALDGADWADGADVVARLAECVPVVQRARADVAGSALDPQRAEIVARHVEGVLATAALPRMANVRQASGAEATAILCALDLSDGSSPTTLAGYTAFFQPIYGLIGSYARPILGVPAALAGGAALTPDDVNGGVDRRINVVASGAAHRGYFQAANTALRRIFDEQPLADQPRAIVDVGCGDGRWLREMFDTVTTRTERGRHLDRHPLTVIGVDYSEAALDVAREGLRSAPAVLLRGDIGDPAAITASIAAATGLADDDLLHVRAFVDHNRSISGVDDEAVRPSTDADPEICVSPDGALLSRQAIVGDWTRHYRRWSQFSRRHGLLVIEGHTVAPVELNGRAGGSHGLAFEFYHNLSGQGPLRWESFQAVTAAAGFDRSHLSLTYPNHARPTTSVQRLVPSAA